jgi:Tfp pilus assembly protein PilF
MKTLAVLLLLIVGSAGTGEAQTSLLERGVAAESASRWEEALALYDDSLRQEPGQAHLWVRVANIQARLGRRDACIAALEAAAAAAPADAGIHRQLSAAQAEAGKPEAALQAIEAALRLEPDSEESLRAHARIATWVGAYGRAQDSYRRLLRAAPADAEVALDFARVSAWAGSTDDAVRAYRRYLRARPDAADAWLELATTESWRGNSAGALDALGQYRQRFGESPAHDHALAAVLARANRPRQAARLLDALLSRDPANYQLTLSRTVAFTAQQKRRDALASLESARQLRPDDPETRGVRGLLRSALASTAEPRGSYYGDSDGLRVQRLAPRVSLSLLNGTRIDGGYERADLRAREGSGLEQVDGALQARHEFAWVGITQQLGFLTVRAAGGPSWVGSGDEIGYTVGAQITPIDTLRASVSRESGFLVVSPRTLSLGLTRVAHRAQIDWILTHSSQLTVEALREDFSDGNRRWDVLVAPRRSFARTQRLNLDLGLQARYLSAAEQLDHGYYDPRRYESYSLTAFPYWKIGENAGLAAALAFGAQRDDSAGPFKPGGNAAVEATFGIYQSWMLKLNASGTFNERLESGAFRGYSGGAALVRRF